MKNGNSRMRIQIRVYDADTLALYEQFESALAQKPELSKNRVLEQILAGALKNWLIAEDPLKIPDEIDKKIEPINKAINNLLIAMKKNEEVRSRIENIILNTLGEKNIISPQDLINPTKFTLQDPAIKVELKKEADSDIRNRKQDLYKEIRK